MGKKSKSHFYLWYQHFSDIISSIYTMCKLQNGTLPNFTLLFKSQIVFGPIWGSEFRFLSVPYKLHFYFTVVAFQIVHSRESCSSAHLKNLKATKFITLQVVIGSRDCYLKIYFIRLEPFTFVIIHSFKMYL